MITSTDNQQIKNVLKLIKSAKTRRESKSYVIEGLRLFKDCPKELILTAFATEEFYDKHKEMLTGIDVKLVNSKVFKAIADTVTPQGIMAVVKAFDYSIEDIIKGSDQTPALLVLENLQDPGNLGTIIRMAEGAGITGIIMSKDTVDVYNPKVVRSTMGSIFRVPYSYVDSLDDAITLLKNEGITVYAGHLDGDDIYFSDFTLGTAILIGNEGNGLTENITRQADIMIRIPMCGKVESLNAAMAATIISYEILRQRH
ncbi:MAG: 23S rRNA (guanosine(2251)-2'-O)-methyltransferase RlmB [Lachnospiraceae bacterium]|nr:23S rRNA (guanosine(2251)-2'-O)-methyltransferase RlmB [Lachnospiraceae bacterium]